MIYDIISSSDPISFEADDLEIAKIAILLVGKGRLGLRDEQGNIFQNTSTKTGNLGLMVYLNREAVIKALESTIVADNAQARARALEYARTQPDTLRSIQLWNAAKRASRTDIAGRAHKIARQLK